MAQDRAFDIVVFGATGFTGGLVADYLAKAGGALRWALAGRNRDKLSRVQERISHTGSRPELIVVDASDESGLAQMAQRTRVVLTTVGPYIRYGEPLVKACAEAGTHYVDLTGEPPFFALTRARYHARARETGAKIVHACGFDSIPHDLGAYFTLRALRERMSEQERRSLPVEITGIVRGSGRFSGGTWHSALEIMGSMGKHAQFQSPEPEGRKVGSLPRSIQRRADLGLWLVPMPTIDPLLVLESARALPEYGPDFRYGHYLGLRNVAQVAGIVAGAGTVVALAQFAPTRKLLGKLRAPGEGPDEATRAKSWFRVLFEAKAGPHTLRAEVSGGDPGYGETAKMIAEAALCLALTEDLPPHYGVVTTAAAMGTALIERLTRAGIRFAVLD
jgi:short subunit dehydrogenase-like uncharacterized protein